MHAHPEPALPTRSAPRARKTYLAVCSMTKDSVGRSGIAPIKRRALLAMSSSMPSLPYLAVALILILMTRPRETYPRITRRGIASSCRCSSRKLRSTRTPTHRLPSS